MSRLNALSAQIGGELWIKREDASAAEYGGNKVRKLELILGAAQAQGARSLITVGGLGSNQVTALATYAGKISATAIAIVHPQPWTPWTRPNLRVWRERGVDIVTVDGEEDLARGMDIATARASKPSVTIAAGCSSPLGNLGAATLGIEIALQISGEMDRPTDIVVPCGTGGTVAAVMLGLSARGVRDVRVVAVRASTTAGAEARIRQHVNAMLHQLRRISDYEAAPLPELVVIDAQAEYGVATETSLHAIALARETEGLALEPTYTGRAIAHAMDLARAGRRVLFVNTASPVPLRDDETAENKPNHDDVDIPEALRGHLK
jgi:D-cysteine desulfhydrase